MEPLQSPQSQPRKIKRLADLSSQTIRLENGRIVTRNVRQVTKHGKRLEGVIEYKGDHVPVLKTSDGRNGTVWVMNSAVVADYPATPPKVAGVDRYQAGRYRQRVEEVPFDVVPVVPVVLKPEQLAFQLGMIHGSSSLGASVAIWRGGLDHAKIPFVEQPDSLGPVLTILDSAWSIHFDLHGKFLYANHGAEKQSLAEALGAIGQ